MPFLAVPVQAAARLRRPSAAVARRRPDSACSRQRPDRLALTLFPNSDQNSTSDLTRMCRPAAKVLTRKS